LENFDRPIRYFVRIAELKSLSRAADLLDLTQSGLSRQLGSLETYLGKALFSRTGRGVELTGAGKLLLDAAKSGYSLIDDAVETVREREGVTQGNVRVAAVHTLSYYFTADVLSTFLGTRPRVKLSLMCRSSPEVVELVESGKADIGFLYDSVLASGELTSTPLFHDEMCLIAYQDDEVEECIDLTVARLKLVGFPPGYALRRMLEGGGTRPEIVAEAETVDAMLRLVASRVGACILPSRMPDNIIGNYGLKKIRILKPTMRRRVVVVVQAGRHPTGLIRELLETAVAKVSKASPSQYEISSCSSAYDLERVDGER
jgi:DNA-binding transcriptional LysR family regulator